MYIPKQYKSLKREDLIAFIQSNPFGQLISNSSNRIESTAIPFLIEERNEQLFLVSHLAKFNPQLNNLNGCEVMVLFQGPHAFISPKHYTKKDSVPTWNYQIAQLRGKISLLEKKEELVDIMKSMIDLFDQDYREKWEKLSEDYMNQVMKAVTGIKIEVRSIEFAEKLSQDRSKEEQANIINAFSESKNSYEKAIAARMKEKLD